MECKVSKHWSYITPSRVLVYGFPLYLPPRALSRLIKQKVDGVTGIRFQPCGLLGRAEFTFVLPEHAVSAILKLQKMRFCGRQRLRAVGFSGDLHGVSDDMKKLTI